MFPARRTFDPWYPAHPERDLYISLLQKQDPPVPESLLKAALLRRAVTDVGRLVRIREDKGALQQLLQKGSVGDDLWNSCVAAEKELEAEILEVVNEANSFRQGYASPSQVNPTNTLRLHLTRWTILHNGLFLCSSEPAYMQLFR